MNVERELALRQIAAHERIGGAQHMESARYLREQWGIPAPPVHPPVGEIFAELRTLGLWDGVKMLLDKHPDQASEGGRHEYQKAFLNLLKLARVAQATHGRESVWIPACMFAEPGKVVTWDEWEFFEVKPVLKGNREWINQERYSK